jgi:hypothetical protein
MSALLSQLLEQGRAELQARRPDSAQDAEVLARLGRVQALMASPQKRLSFVPAGMGLRRVVRGAAWSGLWLSGAALLLALAMLTLDPPALKAQPTALQASSNFLPLVSSADWQRAMGGEQQAAVWLVPATLPRERLALMGLPFDAARANEPLQAELMLHPSGQVLAVRFIQ